MNIDDVCKECRWRGGHSPKCLQDKPLGFEAAKADWNEEFSGRQYMLKDWYELMFGEQEYYRRIDATRAQNTLSTGARGLSGAEMS